jgi:hypothetical protein
MTHSSCRVVFHDRNGSPSVWNGWSFLKRSNTKQELSGQPTKPVNSTQSAPRGLPPTELACRQLKKQLTSQAMRPTMVLSTSPSLRVSAPELLRATRDRHHNLELLDTRAARGEVKAHPPLTRRRGAARGQHVLALFARHRAAPVSPTRRGNFFTIG